MKTRGYMHLATIALVLILTGMAQAQTTFNSSATALTLGPNDIVSGFPISVTDDGGAQLGLCLDPVNCVFDPAIVGNAFSEQIGFGAEAPWFAASATITTAAGNARYAAEIVAAFDTQDADPPVGGGANNPLTRITFRMPVTLEGLYTITHPYGEIVTTVVAGQTEIDEKQEIDLGLAPNVGPFLVAANAPVGFLGNPAAASTVTGGPNGNTLRIQGPGGLDLQMDQFFVMGQELVVAPMTVPAGTVSLLPGQTASVTVTGGVGGMTATTSNSAVATATVRGKTVTVVGGASAGTATISLSDSFSPAHTAAITVELTAAGIVVGDLPGPVASSVLATEPVTLALNITNAQGVLPFDIAQEWLLVLIASGGAENLFFLTANGLVPLDPAASNPSTLTFNGFDHNQSTFFIGNATLGEAGFGPGDIMMFGYAFSTLPLTSFVDPLGVLSPNLVLENIVRINVQ